MKSIRIIWLALALAPAVGVAGASVASPAVAGSSPRTLAVTGSGAVRAVPDRLAFSFGVSSRGKTATAAMAANAAEVRKVLAALRGSGVATRDLRTSSLSLAPRYGEDGETLLGFTASNTVDATIRGVPRSGRVVDAAVRAGANQVDGPGFTRGDEDALYRRALRLAVAAARTKAATLAAAANLRLGPVRSITESSSGPVRPSPQADLAAAPPIEPGTEVVEASVTVEYLVG